MKKLTIIWCLLLCTLYAVATTTITVADYAATEFITEDGHFSIVADEANSGHTAPTYYVTTQDLRIYAGETLTIEAGSEMTSIVLYIADLGIEKLGENTVDCGTLVTDAGTGTITWIGNSNKVVITVADKNTLGGDGNAGAQIRLTALTVEGGTDGLIEGAPLYSIDFTTSQDGWTIDNKEWFMDDFDMGDFVLWSTNENLGYVGNSPGDMAESWLISPAIDLATNSPKYVKLNFLHTLNAGDEVMWCDNARNYLRVKISTDGSSWTDLSVPNWAENSGWTFSESGEIDITNYISETTQIAFVFSDLGVCTGPPTWAINTIKIYASNFAKRVLSVGVADGSEYYGYVEGGGTYPEWSEVTITATPYAGRHFVQWSDGNTENPRTLTLTEDLTLTAEFAENPYYTVSLSGENIYGWYQRYWDPLYVGTSSFSGQNKTISVLGGLQVYVEENGSCGAWLGWSDGVRENGRTITITSDTVISSRFDAKIYKVSITAGEGGYLLSGNIVGERTECHAYINAYAEPKEGYYFTGWSDGVTNEYRDIYLTQDTTIVALFAAKEIVQITIEVASECSNMGDVYGGNDSFYTGETITIGAIANPGYHFVEWSDGNAQVTRDIYLLSDTTLYAIFAAGDFGGKCGPNMYWTWDQTTKALNITGTGYMYLSEYNDWADWSAIDSIHSINIANGVKGIGEKAFYNQYSGWENKHSIAYNLVREVIIPASVDYFGYYSFQAVNDADRIEYLGNTAWVDDPFNEGLAAMNSGTVRYLKVPAGFYGSRLSITDSLVITNGEVNNIWYASPYMDLSAASNTHINLKNIQLYSTSDLLREIILPAGLETIDADALRNCRYLAAITIPAAVTEIGTSAFEDCRSLSSVTFAGKNLQTIGDWAFYNCHELKEITIPEGVTSIGKAAFFNCIYLAELTIPSSMQRIADNGFGACAKLQRMHVNAPVPPAIEAKTFEDVDRTIPVFVPRGTMNLYKADQYWSEFLNIEEYDAPTGILNTASDSQISVRKVLKDGQVLILRGEEVYTLLGEKLR